MTTKKIDEIDKNLSTVFFLSESIVRRVLRQLEESKYIERFHGGAVLSGIVQLLC